MRQDVADVGDACQVHHQALEAQAKACVAASAIAAQVEVVAVLVRIHPQLGNAALQHVEALLTLRAADNLAYARHEAVGGSHGLAVIVQAHVESLDLGRIVGDEDRLAKVLLGEVALVLGLQVAAPAHRILELRPGWEEKVGLVMTESNKDPKEWRKVIGNKQRRDELAKLYFDIYNSQKGVLIYWDIILNAYLLVSDFERFISSKVLSYEMDEVGKCVLRERFEEDDILL